MGRERGPDKPEFKWETRLRVGYVLLAGLSGCVIPISNTSGGSPDAAAPADAQPSFDDAATNAADGEAASTADCVEAGTCPPGTWANVTPASMPAAVLAPMPSSYGPGAVVVDPARPSDLYIGAGSRTLEVHRLRHDLEPDLHRASDASNGRDDYGGAAVRRLCIPECRFRRVCIRAAFMRSTGSTNRRTAATRGPSWAARASRPEPSRGFLIG
jgi:hypothetical protein